MAPERLAAPAPTPYVWPVPVVVCAWARASGANAAEALSQAITAVTADLAGLPVPPSHRAIVVGTQSAARVETIRFASEIAMVGPALVNPALFPLTVMNAPAGIAAIAHHCEGPNVTMCNGATSAFDALVYAADLVAGGRARIVFAGGFETHVADATAPNPDRDAAVAVVAAVMTAAQAQAFSAPVRARLLATACGGFTPAARGAVAAAMVTAAAQAGSFRLLELILTRVPKDGLTVLGETFILLSSATSPVLAPLVASSDDAAGGTALLVGSRVFH